MSESTITEKVGEGRGISTQLTKKAQTRLVGNSVPPHVAAAIIGANFAATEIEAAS